MAVSQEGREHFQFSTGAHYALRVARLILQHGLPEETLINLNVPNRGLREIRGVRVTCLSRRRFENPIIEKVDPHGRKYYWIAGTRVSWSRSKDADHEAIAEGAVSLTPIHLDSTNYGVLDQLRGWEAAIQGRKKTRTSAKTGKRSVRR
jgi:5'/3'-nucleotidase